MKKRLFALTLTLAMLMTMFTLPSIAAGKLEIKAESVTAKPISGETVKVSVNFTNNPGYGYGYIDLSWDSSALELTDIEYTELAPKQSVSAPISNKGAYKISFGDIMAEDNFTGTGKAFTLVFKTSAAIAKGNYAVTLANPEIYDKDINVVESTVSNCEVKIDDAKEHIHTPGTAVKENETDAGYDEVVYCTECGGEITRTYVEKNTSFKIEGGSAAVKSGTADTAKIPVKFTKNPGYGYGYLDVSWDSSALELTDIEYTDLAPKQSAAAPISNKGAYKVSFGDIMAEDNFTGTGTAFTLVFKASSSAAKGDYAITLANPEIYDKDINIVDSAASNGTVKIQDAEAHIHTPGTAVKENETDAGYDEVVYCTECGEEISRSYVKTDTPFRIEGGTVKVSEGESGIPKIPVNITKNPGYGYGYLDISWDTSVMELIEIEYTDLAPKQSTAAPITNNGTYRVSFGDMMAEENFIGTGTAFTLVFKVSGSIKKGDYPIELAKPEIYDKDINVIEASASNALLTAQERKCAPPKDHILTKINRVEPDCEHAGTKEYWKCSDCGKMFSDKDGTKEITAPEIIPAKGHTKGAAVKENVTADGYEEVVYCSVCGKELSRKFISTKDNNSDLVTVMMGDVDGDKTITSADSLLILRRSVSLENFTKIQNYISEIDGDNKISSADALAVLRYSVKLPAEGNVGQSVQIDESTLP